MCSEHRRSIALIAPRKRLDDKVRYKIYITSHDAQKPQETRLFHHGNELNFSKLFLFKSRWDFVWYWVMKTIIKKIGSYLRHRIKTFLNQNALDFFDTAHFFFHLYSQFRHPSNLISVWNTSLSTTINEIVVQSLHTFNDFEPEKKLV